MPAVAVKQPYALVLRKDESVDNPRESNSRFGNMVCFHNRYNLGDEHDYKEPEDFLRELARAVPAKDICAFVLAGLAESVKLRQNEQDGKWLVTARYFKEFEEVGSFSKPVIGLEEEISDTLLEYMDTAALLKLAQYEHVILPLYLYDHSVLSISTAPYSGRAQHADWDSGQVGWIYATKADALNAVGEVDNGVFSITKEILASEVAEYDSFLGGDCYGFQLYKNGNEVNSCWGFIGSPDALKPRIKAYLPDECKDIMDELVYVGTDQEADDYLFEYEDQSLFMEGTNYMSNSEHTAPINLEARAYPFAEPKGKQLAFASVTINDAFAINGIKIIDGGEKGPFVAMPGMKDKEGNYRDICFPTTKELRAKINSVVMDAYNTAITKGLTERAAAMPAKEAERPSAAKRLDKAKKEVAKAPQAPKAEKSAPAKEDAR
jgi:DNA-binding cell septation regulator SpoVG